MIVAPQVVFPVSEGSPVTHDSSQSQKNPKKCFGYINQVTNSRNFNSQGTL